jgi:hypothetical protein
LTSIATFASFVANEPSMALAASVVHFERLFDESIDK